MHHIDVSIELYIVASNASPRRRETMVERALIDLKVMNIEQCDVTYGIYERSKNV